MKGIKAAVALLGVLALTGLVAGCGSAAGQPSTPRTAVVVDTDMSWDDIAALPFLLSRPDVDVKGIAISGDGLTHCDAGVTHARQIASLLGHAGIPVGCGRTVPLVGSAAFPGGWRQNADAFFGLKLPPVPDLVHTPTAVQVLDEALRASTRSVVVSLGPLTNLAETLALHPELGSRISMIYAMAGALDVPGNEFTGHAEWNVFIDPAAASAVLRSGAPVTLVPLDASDDLPVTIFFRDALRKAKSTAAGDLVKDLLADPYYYTGSQYFWDPAAAVLALDQGMGRFADERLRVVEEPGADLGRLVRDVAGAQVRVAVGVDASSFYRSYLSALVADKTASVEVPASRLDVTYGPGGWTVTDAAARAAGPMAVGMSNTTDTFAGVMVARLLPGHTVAEVDAAIKAKVNSAPGWFQIVLMVTVPKGHPATWGVELEPGTWVIVGGYSPLQRLAVIEVG